MANLNSFNRRLDKIESSLPKQDRSQFEWDFSLFTPVEQAELQLFMASLPTSQNGFQLQGEQLFQFGCWLRLETALRDGNMAEAEKYRRRRAMTLEQLVDTFLNLDISSLPRDPNMPGPQVTEGRCTFTFSRTNYRHLCWSVQRCPENLVSVERDDMWRWIEYFT